MTLWPVRSLPPASGALARRAPRSASSCRCRWGRRARRARRAPATARRRRAAARGSPSPTSRRPSSSSKITRPERSGLRELEPSSRASRGSRSMRSILSSFLTRDCAWRGLRRLGAEALDEALHARDLGLLLVDRLARAPSRAPPAPCATSCQVPVKKRERPASSSSTAVPTASRNQRSWATSTIARVERRAASAPATPATRCRGGWSARRAAAGRPRRPARAPARRA